MEKINVQEIISSLKCDCEQDIPKFDKKKYFLDIDNDNYLLHMFECAIIPYYREVEGNIITKYLKRIIRRILKFLLEPCFADISNYNVQLLNLIVSMRNENKHNSVTILNLKKEISELKKDMK